MFWFILSVSVLIIALLGVKVWCAFNGRAFPSFKRRTGSIITWEVTVEEIREMRRNFRMPWKTVFECIGNIIFVIFLFGGAILFMAVCD